MAGWVSVLLAPGPGDGHPAAQHDHGPVPVAVTSTSCPPSLFSTQGPMRWGTVMTTTLSDAVWAAVDELVGTPE